MDHFPSVLARQCRAALSAGLILAFSCNAALSAENCQRLEALANQYAGVELTGAQKQLKRKMATWYSTHCMRPRGSLSLAPPEHFYTESVGQRAHLCRIKAAILDSAAKHEGNGPCTTLNTTATAPKSICCRLWRLPNLICYKRRLPMAPS